MIVFLAFIRVNDYLLSLSLSLNNNDNEKSGMFQKDIKEKYMRAQKKRWKDISMYCQVK